MKGVDRFLIAIVAGAVLLVGAVVAIALLQPNRPSYQPDDTPEGIAHNYLLALQLGEYERAYGYLLPGLSGYPAGPKEFADDVEDNRRMFSGLDDEVSLAVESVRVTGDRATVSVRQTRFYGGGLFDSGQDTTSFDMDLRRVDGSWKIAKSDSFWFRCWDRPDSSGCQ